MNHLPLLALRKLIDDIYYALVTRPLRISKDFLLRDNFNQNICVTKARVSEIERTIQPPHFRQCALPLLITRSLPETEKERVFAGTKDSACLFANLLTDTP